MKLVYTIIKLAILFLFLIFALINTHVVSFSYLPGQEAQWPLILILFCAFLIGIVLGLLAMFGRLLRLRAENSRLRAEVQKAARLDTQDISAPPAQK